MGVGDIPETGNTLRGGDMVHRVAMYPSLTQAFNISKDTKLMTILSIEGHPKHDIVDFCGHLVAPKENAVYLCNKFLNLPNYKEASELYDSSLVPK